MFSFLSMFYEATVNTIINSDMVINEKVSKIYKFSILQVTFSLLKFAGIVLVVIVFIGTVFGTSIISSHVIMESPIILSKYLLYSQVHVLGFQI